VQVAVEAIDVLWRSTPASRAADRRLNRLSEDGEGGDDVLPWER
jgi:hypothetical protein